MRSLYLPLFLRCIYSIAHYRMFVNSADCTIIAALICAECIPCQLGPRPPCTAQRMCCVLVLCVYYIVYCLCVHDDEHEHVSHHVLLIISWSLCVHEHVLGYC